MLYALTLTTLLTPPTNPRPPRCASLTTDPVRPTTLTAASASVLPTSRPRTYPAEKLIAERIITAPAENANVSNDASVDERVEVSFEECRLERGDDDRVRTFLLFDEDRFFCASAAAAEGTRFLELSLEFDVLLGCREREAWSGDKAAPVMLVVVFPSGDIVCIDVGAFSAIIWSGTKCRVSSWTRLLDNVGPRDGPPGDDAPC